MEDPPATPEPEPKKRKFFGLRIAVYGLLLCGGIAWALHLPIDPHRDLDSVIDAAESAEGEGVRFHEGGAFLFFLPKEGYVLTLAVHPDRKNFPKTNFIVVAGGKNGEAIKCTRMVPNRHGWSTEAVLEGDEMRAYLKKVEIDVAPLEQIYQRYYR